ncbi:hypothetical protein, partial [Salmonella enterica]|uniref:hypothetical protein n=1 Tax=Salmonella enterica TaxID=28901 RepID=UPI00301DFB50
LVLSGFASTDLSVTLLYVLSSFLKMDKTALPWPYRFPVKFLPSIFLEISAPPVSRYRSPQPIDRAKRVSVQASVISPAVNLLLTHTYLIFHLLYVVGMLDVSAMLHFKPG